MELVECLDEAGCAGHLCVAVPWLVEYLSMMDAQAATQYQYKNILLLLIAIYKWGELSLAASLELCLVLFLFDSLYVLFRSFGGSSFVSNVGYVIISMLGWLFEVVELFKLIMINVYLIVQQ